MFDRAMAGSTLRVADTALTVLQWRQYVGDLCYQKTCSSRL